MTVYTAPVDTALVKAGTNLETIEAIAAYWQGLASEMEQADRLEGMDVNRIAEIAIDIATRKGADDETNLKDDGTYEDSEQYVLEVFAAFEAEGDEEPAELVGNLKDLADKIAEDTALSSWINRAIAGQKDVERSPVFIASRLLKLGKQEVALIPWPGSRAVLKTGERTGINNPDITVMSRRKSDGTSRDVDVSAVKALIGKHPIMVNLRAAQERIKDAAPDKTKLNVEQSTKVKNLGKDITSANKALTAAFKLALIASHLEDHKHIRLDFHTIEKKDDDGNVVMENDIPVRILDPEMSAYCIDIVNRHNEKNYVTITVAGITKVNPSLITEHVTWSVMVDKLLARKKQKDPATPVLNKFVEPESVAEFSEFSSVAVHTLEKASMFSQLNVAMAHTAGEQKETADDIILNVGRLEELCADLLKTKGRRTRLAELRRAQAAKGERPAEPEVDAA